MPRSKRKFEPEEEMAANASRSNAASRSVPTPETQDLYDAMRRIEDEISFDDHLRLRNGPGSNDEHGDFLQLPSPSQPPTSPRSPSCASTTHSLTRGLDDVGIDDDEPHKRRRAVRHGPLDALDRAQAALMRKLGACADCKFRKVKCTHFDRTLFEERYQVYKRSAQAALSIAHHPELVTTSSQPSFNNGTATEIGSWQLPSLPLQSAPGDQHDEAEAEILAIEDDVRNAASASTNTAAPYYFANLSRISANPLGPMNSLSPYVTAPDPLSYGLSGGGDSPVPIGRRVGGPAGIMWECRHGDDGTSALVNEAGVCNLRLSSLPELCQHFQTEHSPFSRSFCLWKCIIMRGGDSGPRHLCGFLTGEASTSCFECQGNQWELWYYCTVIRTPSLTSGPSVRVGSQDGYMIGGRWPYNSSQSHSSSYTQVDFQMLFPGRYMGPNQSGSYHSFGSRSLETKVKDHCFRGVPVYSRGCPYGRKCRRLRQPSEYITKAQFLLAISVLSLVVMEQWLVAGVSLIGSKGLVSAVVEVARNHVFWMSLLCLLAGLAGMWLFKHIRFRPVQNSEASCHQRCLARGFFGVPRLDIEDAGSIRDDDETGDADGDGFRRSKAVTVR